MDKDIALKKAIDALDFKGVRESEPYWEMMNKAIQACKEALAQPSQEPVLNVVKILNEFPLLDDEGLDEDKHHCEWAIQQDRKRLHAMIKNTNPAPSWQGLSDDEIVWLCPPFYDEDNLIANEFGFARAIEQALKEKNS